MDETSGDSDGARLWQISHVCKRVAVIHIVLVTAVIAITWKAGWSEIGPTWLLFAFIDWPASVLVIQMFVDDLLDYEAHKVSIIFCILLLGSIQWVLVAALTTTLRNRLTRHSK